MASQWCIQDSKDPGRVLSSHWPGTGLQHFLNNSQPAKGIATTGSTHRDPWPPSPSEEGATSEKISISSKEEEGGIWAGRQQCLLPFLVLFHFVFCLETLLSPGILEIITFIICYFRCVRLYRIIGIAHIHGRVYHSLQALSPVVLFMLVSFS